MSLLTAYYSQTYRHGKTYVPQGLFTTSGLPSNGNEMLAYSTDCYVTNCTQVYRNPSVVNLKSQLFSLASLRFLPGKEPDLT